MMLELEMMSSPSSLSGYDSLTYCRLVWVRYEMNRDLFESFESFIDDGEKKNSRENDVAFYYMVSII
jgi:hypothetical protein